MIPPEGQIRRRDTNQTAKDDVEAEVVEFRVARGTNVDGNGDWSQGRDQQVVGWGGCSVAEGECVVSERDDCGVVSLGIFGGVSCSIGV